MRDYLAKQVEEKKQKEIAEKSIDEKQAKVWQEDTSNFNDNEKKKSEYMKEIHKQHEEVLKAQMSDKDAKKNRKKMNTLELLYNKALMKAAAEEGQPQVKKAKVWLSISINLFSSNYVIIPPSLFIYDGFSWINIYIFINFMNNSEKMNPNRFEVYTELPDGKGFTIPNCKFVFKLDRFGGWKDEFGQYFNQDGEKDEQP